MSASRTLVPPSPRHGHHLPSRAQRRDRPSASPVGRPGRGGRSSSASAGGEHDVEGGQEGDAAPGVDRGRRVVARLVTARGPARPAGRRAARGGGGRRCHRAAVSKSGDGGGEIDRRRRAPGPAPRCCGPAATGTPRLPAAQRRARRTTAVGGLQGAGRQLGVDQHGEQLDGPQAVVGDEAQAPAGGGPGQLQVAACRCSRAAGSRACSAWSLPRSRASASTRRPWRIRRSARAMSGCQLGSCA